MLRNNSCTDRNILHMFSRHKQHRKLFGCSPLSGTSTGTHKRRLHKLLPYSLSLSGAHTGSGYYNGSGKTTIATDVDVIGAAKEKGSQDLTPFQPRLVNIPVERAKSAAVGHDQTRRFDCHTPCSPAAAVAASMLFAYAWLTRYCQTSPSLTPPDCFFVVSVECLD